MVRTNFNGNKPRGNNACGTFNMGTTMNLGQQGFSVLMCFAKLKLHGRIRRDIVHSLCQICTRCSLFQLIYNQSMTLLRLINRHTTLFITSAFYLQLVELHLYTFHIFIISKIETKQLIFSFLIYITIFFVNQFETFQLNVSLFGIKIGFDIIFYMFLYFV